MRRLQDMMLEAEAARSTATSDLRIAREDLAAAASRTRALELCREEALQRADAAHARVTMLEAAHSSDNAQRLRHESERVSMQQRRIEALAEQGERLGAQLCEAEAARHAADAAEREQATHAAELGAALRAAQSQLDTVTAQRDGLQMELAGTSEVESGGTRARDAHIVEYVDTHLFPLLKRGCVHSASVCFARGQSCAHCGRSATAHALRCHRDQAHSRHDSTSLGAAAAETVASGKWR